MQPYFSWFLGTTNLTYFGSTVQWQSVLCALCCFCHERTHIPPAQHQIGGWQGCAQATILSLSSVLRVASYMSASSAVVPRQSVAHFGLKFPNCSDSCVTKLILLLVYSYFHLTYKQCIDQHLRFHLWMKITSPLFISPNIDNQFIHFKIDEF